jgi:hypothetical protein
MGGNPAGLGVFRSSEWVITLGLLSPKTTTIWGGQTTETRDKAKLTLNNFSYVGSFGTGSETGVVSWSAGFSYNKVKDYTRNYRMGTAGRTMNSSVSDYIAQRSAGYSVEDLEGDKAYGNGTDGGADWLSVLGYQAGLIAFDDYGVLSAFGNFNGEEGYIPYPISGATLQIEERGAASLYNMAFGLNISNRIFAGASVAITSMDYSYKSIYDEKFENDDDLFLDNNLSTSGTGYTVNIGMIVRPTDFLRLGVAYHSPVWYNMTDYFYGKAGSSVTVGEGDYRELFAITPSDDVNVYKYRSPDKWLLSTAVTFGQSGLLSVDYELTNYAKMSTFEQYNAPTNDGIKANMGQVGTLRIGGEWKATPQLALRAGWNRSQSAIIGELGQGKTAGEGVVAGTIPHFTIDRGMTNYTFGLGYRFTPRLYADMACVLERYKEDAYAFPNITDMYNDIPPVSPATLKTNRTHVALTFGCKF